MITMVLAIVIIPSGGSESAIIATKISEIPSTPEVKELFNRLYENTIFLDRLKYWGKLVFFVVYLGIISLFVYKKREMFLKRKKVM